MYLASAGWVGRGGMGGGLSWPELDRWAYRTEYLPDPWEFEALHKLSGVYASMFSAASDPDEPPPSSQLRGGVQNSKDMASTMDALVASNGDKRKTAK